MAPNEVKSPLDYMPVNTAFAVTNTTNTYHFAIAGGTTLDFDETSILMVVAAGQTADFYVSEHGIAPTRLTGTSMTSPAGATDAATAIALIQALAPGMTEPGDMVVSGTITGNRVYTEEGTPIDPLELTSKTYVDALAGNGVLWKESVRVATTGNIALTGEQTIDGVAISAGERVLVRAQTAPAENGIYVASAGAWARSLDADGTPSAELSEGAAVSVQAGALYAGTIWALVSFAGTIDVDAQTWTQLNLVQAGAGLTQTGNTVLVNQATDFTWSGRHRFAGDSAYIGSAGVGAAWNTAAHDAELQLNFSGYQDGIVYRRQVGIYDGRNTRVALIARNTTPELRIGGTTEESAYLRVISSATGTGYIMFGDNVDDIGGLLYNHGSNGLITRINGDYRTRLDESGFHPMVDGLYTLGTDTVRWLNIYGDGMTTRTLTTVGTTSINESGTAGTTIGNITSTTAMNGTVNVNTGGSGPTTIGNILSATTLLGPVNINDSGVGATTIGNSSSTTAIRGTTNINATGGAATNIGNSNSTTTIGRLDVTTPLTLFAGSATTWTSPSGMFSSDDTTLGVPFIRLLDRRNVWTVNSGNIDGLIRYTGGTTYDMRIHFTTSVRTTGIVDSTVVVNCQLKPSGELNWSTVFPASVRAGLRVGNYTSTSMTFTASVAQETELRFMIEALFDSDVLEFFETMVVIEPVI